MRAQLGKTLTSRLPTRVAMLWALTLAANCGTAYSPQAPAPSVADAAVPSPGGPNDSDSGVPPADPPIDPATDMDAGLRPANGPTAPDSGPALIDGQPFWDDRVTHLTVFDWDYWSGGRRLSADVEQLSAQQLELLAAIEVVPYTTDVDCPTAGDGVNYEIAVARGDAIENYDANVDHVQCTSGSKSVGWESFLPFEATIDCAPGLGRSGITTLKPSLVCEHGVYPFDSEVLEVPIEVETRGEYRFFAIDCGSSEVRLELVDEGETSLGMSMLDKEHPDCGRLTLFLEPGRYLLRIDTSNHANDFFLRFEPASDL